MLQIKHNDMQRETTDIKVRTAAITEDHAQIEKEFRKLQEAHRNLLSKEQNTVKQMYQSKEDIKNNFSNQKEELQVKIAQNEEDKAEM